LVGYAGEVLDDVVLSPSRLLAFSPSRLLAFSLTSLTVGCVDTGKGSGVAYEGLWTVGRWEESTETWTAGLVSMELEYADGQWSTTTTMDLRWECAECSIDEVPMVLHTSDAEETDGLVYDLRMPDETELLEQVAATMEPDDDLQVTDWTIELPASVEDQDVIRLEVRLPKEESPTARSVFACVEPLTFDDEGAEFAGRLCAFEFGAGSSTGTGLALDALPAFPVDAEQTKLTVETVVRLPTILAVQPLAPGLSTSSTAGGETTWTFPATPPTWPRQVQVLLLPIAMGVDATHPLPSGADLDVWLDPGLQPSVASFMEGSGSSALGGAVDQVAEYLGEDPGWHTHMVVLRRSEHSRVDVAEPVGMAVPGLILLDGAQSSGGTVTWMKTAAVHELAHIWVNTGLSEAGAHWMVEGTATLISLMAGYTENLGVGHTVLAKHYRDEGATLYFSYSDIPHVAVETLADRMCEEGGDEIGLEAIDQPTIITYYGGATTLAQALFTWRALGGSSAAFWGYLGTLVQGEEPMTVAQVQAFFIDNLEMEDFYTSRIQAGAYGVPLLAIDDLDITGSGAEVTVRQVQGRLYSAALCGDHGEMPTFDDVPFLLACGTYDDETVQPFHECAVPDSGTLFDESSGSVRRMTAAYETVNLTAAVSDPWPSWLWVVGDDALLPGRVPMAGRGETLSAESRWGTSRRLLRCDDGFAVGTSSAAPGCQVDADGDDYPPEGDCDDSSSTVHPLIAGADHSGAGIDENCDSWKTKLTP
jgi:hypothetical protein